MFTRNDGLSIEAIFQILPLLVMFGGLVGWATALIVGRGFVRGNNVRWMLCGLTGFTLGIGAVWTIVSVFANI